MSDFDEDYRGIPGKDYADFNGPYASSEYRKWALGRSSEVSIPVDIFEKFVDEFVDDLSDLLSFVSQTTVSFEDCCNCLKSVEEDRLVDLFELMVDSGEAVSCKVVLAFVRVSGELDILFPAFVGLFTPSNLSKLLDWYRLSKQYELPFAAELKLFLRSGLISSESVEFLVGHRDVHVRLVAAECGLGGDEFIFSMFIEAVDNEDIHIDTAERIMSQSFFKFEWLRSIFPANEDSVRGDLLSYYLDRGYLDRFASDLGVDGVDVLPVEWVRKIVEGLILE